MAMRSTGFLLQSAGLGPQNVSAQDLAR
jgi:hypothetical protein